MAANHEVHPEGTQVRIVFYCKSGRHRSVAAALVAAHLFEATVGLPMPRSTLHLSAYWWSQLCGPNCLECTQQTQLRDGALRRAREMWREVVLARN